MPTSFFSVDSRTMPIKFCGYNFTYLHVQHFSIHTCIHTYYIRTDGTQQLLILISEDGWWMGEATIKHSPNTTICPLHPQWVVEDSLDIRKMQASKPNEKRGHWKKDKFTTNIFNVFLIKRWQSNFIENIIYGTWRKISSFWVIS